MENKNFMIWLVLVILLSTLLTPVKAETFCFYAGPDLSEDLLQLTNFSVTGPFPLKVGDAIIVKFNLKNFGQSDLDLGAKGIFAAARDPDNIDAAFGFSYAYTTIEVMQTLSVEVSRILDKAGTWKIWPSYHISLATGEKFGPDEWHICHITAEPVSPPDFIVEKIECGSGNKLSVTIKNIGQGSLPIGWTAVADVYFNGVKKGFFDLTTPTTTTYGGIEEPGGISTYLLAWDITEPTIVKVIADSKNDMGESNEQNNVGEEEIGPLEKLPDLIIDKIECDRENSRIGYVIKNVGEGTAKAGQATTLYVNNKEISYDVIGIDLKPGETYESWFKEYKWPECTTIKVKVCADDYNEMNESNEENNCLEKTCECIGDIIPPLTISGPTVSETTQTSAIICWETDEASDSLIRYNNRAGKYNSVVEDPNLVKEHCLELTNLKPATTYQFVVESIDSSGNKVRSRPLSFETLSISDDENPSLSLLIPDNLSGIATISVDAQDNTGVDRVVFFCDGKPVYTDFSSPFKWDFNTLCFDEGDHIFTVQAFDIFGNVVEDSKGGTIHYPLIDPTSPTITFLNPHYGDNVSGSVRIEADIEDHEGYIQKCEMYIDGILTRRWVYTPFRFDPFEDELIPNLPTSKMSFTYFWNTTGLEFGSEHLIEVRAWDNSSNYNYTSIKVKKPPLEAIHPGATYVPPKFIDIEVTRSVVRGTNGNWFEVWLTIKNVGTEDLTDFIIMEKCRGFQAVPLSSDTLVQYYPDDKWSVISITPVMEVLKPGESWIFLYHVVPILFDPPLGDNEYVIGFDRTWVTFMYEHRIIDRDFELPYGHPDLIPELDDSFRTANYLIVTEPQSLFEVNHSDRDGVNLLLQEAATLAREKLGVLGYLRYRARAECLKSRISPGGDWANRLSDAFTYPDIMDAYLLIVGETEIVPSYNFRWVEGGELHRLNFSDHYYADVVGDGSPDLIVGRIIGDTARDLMKPIQVSLDVMIGNGFDRTFAIAVSGYENGIDMVHTAEGIARDLNNQGIPSTTMHWSDFVKRWWNVRFTDYDAFALGDVDGDGIDEVIIASDEESRIYIYDATDGSLMRDFPCQFTRYDGFAMGDLDGDRRDEIVIAVDDDDMIYIYEPNGTLVGSWDVGFDNWDALATGDILSEYGETRWKEEVIIASEGSDHVRIYDLDVAESRLRYLDSFSLDCDFTRFDGFAVGNVRNDWDRDEIVVIKDDDQKIYIYDVISVYTTISDTRVFQLGDLDGDGTNDVRFTHYDGFAIGDLRPDFSGEDMVVICDDDKKIYDYYWNGTDWIRSAMYSKFLGSWFNGIRYTASDTRHDGFAIGKVIPDENQKIATVHWLGDSGRFGVLVSTWDEADKWANERLSRCTPSASILTVYGHGNPWGANPMGASYADMYNFSQHPFILALSCSAGYYETVHPSFGDVLFDRGAAVFIASTEVTYSGFCERTARNFFKDYWDVWSERVGKAFVLYERDSYHDGLEYYVREFNYYGDPKFPMGG